MNQLVLAFVAALIMAGILTASTLVYWSIKTRKEADAKELARRPGTGGYDAEHRLFQVQAKDDWATALGRWGKEIEGIIRQANVPYNVSGLVQRMVLAGILGAVLFAVLMKHWIPAVLGFLFVFYIPVILLRRAAEKRSNKLSEQLPDALDLVGRSMQAGHGLADAMRMCAEEMPMPIASEFARVYEEHNLGRDFRDALEDMAERNPRNFDLKIFVSSVLLQRDTGGNLIEILDNIAKTIRDRFVFQAKVLALTAEARFSAYILGGLPFAITGVIMTLRPDYLLPLIEDPMGHLMLAAIGTLFTVGVIVMRNVSQIETEAPMPGTTFIVVAALLASGAVMLMFYGVRLFMNPERTASDRISELTGTSRPEQSLFQSQQISTVASGLSRLAAPSEAEQSNLLRLKLIQAGFRSRSNLEVYSGSRALLAIVLPVLMIAIIPTDKLSSSLVVGIAVLGVAMGYYLPAGLVDRRLQQRQAELMKPFPDALDLLVSCVEAGLGLDASFRRVASELETAAPLLSQELHQVNLEVNAGVPRIQALRGLDERTGLSEVNSLVNVLTQAERFGTSVARALRVHADLVRTKRMLAAEERAGKISPKLTVAMILFIMPSLIIVLIGPAIINVIRILLPAMAGN